jgi:hypothetical protein
MDQKRAEPAYEMIDAKVLQRLRCDRRRDHCRRWRDLGVNLDHYVCEAPSLIGEIGDLRPSHSIAL